MAKTVIKDEIVISGDPALIWNLITDVSRWSRVSRLIKRAAIYGTLTPGTELKFHSGKWDFDGVIIEATEYNRFVFNARSVGLHLNFVWEIEDQIGESKVNATVAASGWIISLFKRKALRSLEDNLFTWLYALKTTIERGEKTKSIEAHKMAKRLKKSGSFGPFGLFFKHHGED